MNAPGYHIVDQTNVYINTGSGLNPDSTGDDIKLTFNDVNVKCGENQFFKLCFKQFSMYKSWTNVNANNSFFVMHDGSSYFTESLTHKNYASIRDLVTDFATQVNTALIREGAYTTSTVTVNSPLTANDLTTGVFDFTISSTDVPHGLNDGDLKLHANVSLGNFYRLLGAKRSKVDNDVDGWQMTAPDANTLQFRGYYNCQLSIEAYIYLHCSTSSCSIATRNYTLGSKDAPGPQLDHSTLLAKVPQQNFVLAYDSQTRDEYVTLLKNIKQISYMELDLRDSKGRRLPLIAAGQNTDGNRSFECLIEIQTIQRTGSHQGHFRSPKDDDKSCTHSNTRPLVYHKNGRTGY
eukprot:4771378-Pleurochrysis_carterae.AAC.2